MAYGNSGVLAGAQQSSRAEQLGRELYERANANAPSLEVSPMQMIAQDLERLTSRLYELSGRSGTLADRLVGSAPGTTNRKDTPEPSPQSVIAVLAQTVARGNQLLSDIEENVRRIERAF